MLKQCISRKEVAVEDLIDIGSFHNKLITLGTMRKTVNGHQGFDFVMTVWNHNKERKLEGDTYTLEVPDPNRVFSDDEDSEEDYDIMYLPRTMHMNSCVWGDFLVTAVLLGTRACLQFWDKNFECAKWIYTLKGILDSIEDRKLAHPLCTWGDYLAVGLGPTVQLWSYKFNKQSEVESQSKKSKKNVFTAEMEGMYEEETPSPLKIYHHGHIKIPSRCRTMCVFRSMLWTVQNEGNVLGWKLPNVQKPCAQLPPATDLIVWCDYLVAVSPENIIKIYYIDKEVKKMAELVQFDARTKVTRLVIWQKKLCIIGESVVKMMNFGDFACVWASEFSGKRFTGSYAIWNSSLWLQTPESYVGLQVKLPWKFQRLIWVAWMKNQAEECWLAAVPREIIHRIIRIIKGSALEYVHPNAEIPQQWRFS